MHASKSLETFPSQRRWRETFAFASASLERRCALFLHVSLSCAEPFAACSISRIHLSTICSLSTNCPLALTLNLRNLSCREGVPSLFGHAYGVFWIFSIIYEKIEPPREFKIRLATSQRNLVLVCLSSVRSSCEAAFLSRFKLKAGSC